MGIKDFIEELLRSAELRSVAPRYAPIRSYTDIVSQHTNNLELAEALDQTMISTYLQAGFSQFMTITNDAAYESRRRQMVALEDRIKTLPSAASSITLF